MYDVCLCDGEVICTVDTPEEAHETASSLTEEYPEIDVYVRQGNRFISVMRMYNDKVVELLGSPNAEPKTTVTEESVAQG